MRPVSATRKFQNLHRDYSEAVRRLHDNGVMVNGSFVFGMDGHDATVFDRTIEWAIINGIETSTFHILTPYPSTELHTRMQREGRLLHNNWDLYDTRHCVYRPSKLTADILEAGYWRAYKDFYRWGSILQGADQREMVRPAAALRLCRRMEKVRAAVGFRHPCQARHSHVAAAGNDP